MPRLLPGETQISTTISEAHKAKLVDLDLGGRKSIRAKVEYLIDCEFIRQKHPHDLVDDRLQYHTHAEPVFGPGSGYEPWATGTANDEPVVTDASGHYEVEP